MTKINYETIVDNMTLLPSQTKKDIIKALSVDENKNAQLHVVQEIFSGRKKELEEKKEVDLTPDLYKNIVETVQKHEPMIKHDLAKIINDNKKYDQNDKQSLMNLITEKRKNSSLNL